MQYRDESEELPVKAITFNHRQMAFYQAKSESPDSLPLLQTEERGLKGVRMLRHDCPVYLIKEMVRLHNLSHGGSGVHIFDIIDHALELEDMWQAHCSKTGLTAGNPFLGNNWKQC